MDEVDAKIVELLRADARLPTSTIATRVGVAPSTAHARVRGLVERGVIAGFHAVVAPAAVGRPLQAMVAVRLRVHARANLRQFARRLAVLPGVLNVFFLAGSDDFQIHVATRDSDELRDFVADNLSTNPEVAMTETHLIFEHLPGTST